MQEADMRPNHRRPLSLALPALVFFFLTLVETVEVRAVTGTLFSLSLAAEQQVRKEISPRIEDAFRVKTCKPIRKGASAA
jgi:hypothetical protein